MIANTVKIEVVINTPDTLLQAVAAHFKISKAKLISDTRKYDVVFVRQIYTYIGFKYYKFPKLHLSRCLQQDHTSGLNSIKKIKGFIEIKDDKVLKGIDSVLKYLHYEKHTKKSYEIRYDNLLIESFSLKSEIKSLKKTIESLKLNQCDPLTHPWQQTQLQKN